MGLLRLAYFIFAFVCFDWNANAGQASSKLSSLSDSLIRDYHSKYGVSGTNLAVFPFNCDDKLERKRVGFAVSELMSHRFVSEGSFSVSERGELAKLLSEQKFQASGAVDNETAVRLGKILGARIALIGNIQKLGAMYQVNARLVNTETAEVLVSGYEELSAETFDEDARMYLYLVPEKQTLGIYGVLSVKTNSNKTPSYSIPQMDSSLVTVKPKSFRSSLLGYGLLYRPIRNLQIGAERAEFTATPDYADVSITIDSHITNVLSGA